jgi:hypothetical protein
MLRNICRAAEEGTAAGRGAQADRRVA